MFKVPTCVNPATAQPIRVNNCPRNENSDNWLTPAWEQNCYDCNPFGVHDNDRMQDGCYKWAFKIACNEENCAFVENQWVQHQCNTTNIPCCSIKTGCCSGKQCFQGYTVQGVTFK